MRVIRFFTASIQRRILSSFAVVIVLVLMMAMAGYYQLNQVRNSAEQITLSSLQMSFLQDFALALSSLDADLERFFVIGGAQFREDILQDLEDMTNSLDSMKKNVFGAPPPTLEELEKTILELNNETLVLLQTESTGATAREMNEKIISVYSRIDRSKQLQQQFSTEMMDQLQATLLRQKNITANVIAQFLILGISVSLITIVASLFVTRSIAMPLASLAKTAAQIAAGDLERVVKFDREDEIGTLADTFNSMITQLRQTLAGLEQRTRELSRRSTYLEASAEVGRAASSTLNAEQLINQVVELVRDRFKLYHVALFLIDESGQWAKFHAGSGEAGHILQQQEFRLQVGGRSMIGWCMANAQARVAQDVSAEHDHVSHSLLPETRSEAALPLTAHGQVIGALSVQSDQIGAFDSGAIAVLQTMADQIAVALDNARLFAENQAALESERRAYGEITHEAWGQLLRTIQIPGYSYTGNQVVPISGLQDTIQHLPQPETQAASTSNSKTSALDLPIIVRGQAIGIIDLHKNKDDPWSPEEIEFAQSMADQLAQALENARLYEGIQRRAVQEKLIGKVTARLRESLDIDRVLQTATRELGEALGAARLNVRLISEESSLNQRESEETFP